LALPAGAIAFYAVCVAAFAVSPTLDVGLNLGFWLGGLAWISVSGGIIYFAVRQLRHRWRK
jgi:hypothetical protein